MSSSPSRGKLWYSLHPKFRTIGIIAVVIISAFSVALFFYLQELTREEIRSAVFEQHKAAQIEATRRLSEHIGTDLNLIVNTIEGLTNSYYLQQGNFSSKNAKSLIQEKYEELSPRISSLLILDRNNIVAVSHAPALSETFLSSDFSQRKWVMETRASGMPLYSDGFERQGIYRIFISYPIVSRETQEILGIIAISIPTVPYFAYYANVHDVNTQFLVTFNREGTLLAVGASQELVGESFFGQETQNFINHDPILNNLTRSLFEGHSGSALYDYGAGERFTTQSPVYVRGQPLYFIQLVTPTPGIYSEVDSSLQGETAKLLLIFSASVISVGVLAAFLLKWNSTLSSEVNTRTRQLADANQLLETRTRQLADANERLEINLKAQKEFLEIAAHEIRTPVQPILGLAQTLQEDATESTADDGRAPLATSHERQLLEVIIRNANRLKDLTDDLLDVSKIDSRSLRLNRETFDMSTAIEGILQDLRNSLGPDSKIGLICNPCESAMVNADKQRVTQVVSNLLNNSQKFAKEGTIEVGIKRNEKEVMVTVKDSGEGIHPDVFQRLFVKFVSRSDGGTGLGLYISKGIIEAHGGRIWAENNTEGKGASFHFALPLAT